MNAVLIAKVIIAASTILNLILFRCWTKDRAVARWYRQQFYSVPRINSCPVKPSRLARIIQALLIIKTLN